MGNRIKYVPLLLLLSGCIATADADTVISGGSISIVESASAAFTGKSRLQFTGAGVTSVLQDTGRSDRIIVTIGGGGGGSGYNAILINGGAALPAETTLNWIVGSAYSCVDNAGSTRTDCTLSQSPNGSASLVGTGRLLTCGNALTGCGDLSGDRTLAVTTSPTTQTPVGTGRQLVCGNALTGCGDFSADRTLVVTTSPVNQTAVGVTRNVNTAHALSGGGPLSADLSLDITTSPANAATVVGTSRNVNTSNGLTGGGPLSGDLTLAPTYGFAANTFLQGSDTLDQFNAPAASVSMNSQRLINLATCSASSDGCPKSYIDALVQGLQTKPPVRVATTAALAANTYLFVACAGDTITMTANGALTLDGVALALNDRVLIKNEGTSSHDGIYIVTQQGTGILPTIFTRASDMNASTEFPGAYALVLQGTLNQNTGWNLVADPDVTFTCGTTGQTWSQFTGAGDITFNAPLSKSGNTVSIGFTTALNLNGSNLDVTAASPSVTVKSENTAASAGSANSFVRTDAQLQVATAAPSTAVTSDVNASTQGSSNNLIRADARLVATTGAPTVTVKSEATATAQGSSASLLRADMQIQAATAVPGTNVTSDANAATQGSSSSLLRADARLVATTAAPTAASIHSDHDAATQGTSASLIRADAIHTAVTAAPSTLDGTATNTQGTSNSLSRADHTHGFPASINVVTTFSAAGTALTVTNTFSAGILNLANNASIPAAPSSPNLQLFNTPIAGKQVIGTRNADQYGFQGTRFGAGHFFYMPLTGDGTTIAGEGLGILYITQGTVSHPALSNASYQGSLQRITLTSAASNNSFAALCSGSTACETTPRGIFNRGDATNKGGYYIAIRFSAETNTAATSAFIGLRTAGTTNADPSAYTDEYGIGYRTTDVAGNWFLFRSNNGTPATAVDLGSNCARSTTNVFTAVIYAPSNGSFMGLHVYNDSTQAQCVERTDTTTLPQTTVFLMLSQTMNTNGTTTAQVLDVMYNDGELGPGVN